VIEVQKGDIYFAAGVGLVAEAIREDESLNTGHAASVNHVGLIVGPDDCVEALTAGIKHHSFSGTYRDSRQLLAVVRPLRQTPEQIDIVCAAALRFAEAEGQHYGWDKILLQAFDSRPDIIEWIESGRDNHPDCSVMVGACEEHVEEAAFGRPFVSLSPENIWDVVLAQGYWWQMARLLGPWGEAGA
jgi:hypothetical protein